MSLVPGYGSDDDDSDEDPWAADAAVNAATGKASVAGNRAAVPSDSDDSDEEDSDDEDNHAPAEEPAPSLLLPKPDEAFAFVEGPPAFLRPEATKQMNVAPGAALGKYRRPGDGDESEEEEIVHRDAAPASAVLESKAVRYDPGEPQGELAAHMAAHGTGGGSGKVDLNRDDRKKKTATKAMEVDDFMAKGGALPRKRAEQKEREEKKRKLGQSSHAEWKTEAEMVLRQQYD